MVSLDTNVVLRFLLDDIPEQTKIATDIIESNRVYVTDVVVVESIYVMEKVMRLTRQDITMLVTNFLGFSNVVHNPYFLEDVIQFYEHNSMLSIVDCYAAAEAKAYENELVTFDKALAKHGGKQVRNLLV
jgi:predicted nucleic-acid-binding protein